MAEKLKEGRAAKLTRRLLQSFDDFGQARWDECRSKSESRANSAAKRAVAATETHNAALSHLAEGPVKLSGKLVALLDRLQAARDDQVAFDPRQTTAPRERAKLAKAEAKAAKYFSAALAEGRKLAEQLAAGEW